MAVSRNIERDAKDLIVEEVKRESDDTAKVEFEPHRHGQVKVTIKAGKETRIFTFQTLGNDWSLRSIRQDVRRHLRGMGVIPYDKSKETIRVHKPAPEPPPPRVGSLGDHLQEAFAAKAEAVKANKVNGSSDEDDDDIDLKLPERFRIAAAKSAAVPAPPAKVNGHAAAPPKSRKQYKFTHDQVFALTLELSKCGAINKDNGTYSYADGHSDETVRDAVAKDLPVEKITEFRRDKFGPLPSEVKVAPYKLRTHMEINSAVSRLQAEVEDLQKRLSKIEPIIKELGGL